MLKANKHSDFERTTWHTAWLWCCFDVFVFFSKEHITSIKYEYIIIVTNFRSQNTLLEWRNVFWISGGVVIVANSIYLFLASASIQWWNDPVPTSETDDGGNDDWFFLLNTSFIRTLWYLFVKLNLLNVSFEHSIWCTVIILFWF